MGTGKLPEPITVILCAKFENLLELDSNQGVLCNIVRGQHLN